MSKLEQNTTSLDEVLAMVNALPDAGSGGGASVETCSVTINVNGMNMSGVASTVFDGEIGYNIINSNTTQINISDVVLGTVIAVTLAARVFGTSLFTVQTGGGVVYVGRSTDYGTGYFIAPTTAGATGTITMDYD